MESFKATQTTGNINIQFCNQAAVSAVCCCIELTLYYRKHDHCIG